MPLPSNNDLTEFSFRHIWEGVVSSDAPATLNLRIKFSQFLQERGYLSIIAEEYAERNIGLLQENILKVLGEWEALGVPRPLEVTDRVGTAITWMHPNFEEVSGRPRLPAAFCDVWAWVRECREREFLFCCAAYLHICGCERVYVTDTTGDGGVDLIGIIEKDPLAGVVVLVQSKTSLGDVSKESLFSDYTKFLLLKHTTRWAEYRRASGIEKACAGAGILYLFASNKEFNPGIVQAARDLPILLRSGRQIAHSLCRRADVEQWKAVRAHVGEPTASLSKNVCTSIAQKL
jgi:hypothetical protein